jgi:hypothetical protein
MILLSIYFFKGTEENGRFFTRVDQVWLSGVSERLGRDISFAILLLLFFFRSIMENLPERYTFIDIHDMPTGAAGVFPPNYAGEGVLVCLV